MNTYEIEHWPYYFGKHALKRLAVGYVKGVLLLLAFATVFTVIYFVTHLSAFYTLASAFVFVIFITPILPIVSFIQRNKKNPSYGINKEGFMLNERGWNSAFFNWSEIKEIKDFNHPSFGPELHFEFVSSTSALNKPGQEKYAQSLAREYTIEKQPKKISNQLVKGDVSEFIKTFKKYYLEYKNAHPISSIEAYDLAYNYIKDLGLAFEIKPKNFAYEESIRDINEAGFLFPIEHMENCSVVVSMHQKSVLGIQTEKKIDKPHLIENNLDREEAMRIIIENMALNQKNAKVLNAHFYYGGMGPYASACWIVYTQQNEIEVDYIIDAVTKEIVDSIEI
jgi:hypothetical protein